MPDLDVTFVQPPKVTTKLTAELPTIPGYEVIKLLGQGGMGQVYQARHQKLQRIVALKVVTAANDNQALARFEEEVKAIASLRHPGIAQIYESGFVEGRPFYAMEYVAGGSLSEELKEGPLAPRDAAELLLALARAMQHAHEQNILHRDLKPSNILLEPDSLEPKVADFGLAKRLSNDTKLTRTGEVFGSPSYMAPEQASGVMKLTTSVDVYALGAILYECLTGRPPFLGPDPMQTVMMVLSTEPVAPRQLQPKLPRDLETICLKCLEKMPRRRYGSVEALADDLECYLEGEPITARPVSNSERLWKWATRKPWQAAAAILAILFMAGLIISFITLKQAYTQTQQANKVSDDSFQNAKKTLNEVITDLAGQLAFLPGTDKILLDSFRRSVRLFRELHTIRPDDRQTALEYFDQLHSFQLHLVNNRKFEEAVSIVKEANDLLAEQLPHQPHDVDWKMAEVRLLINQGWIARQQNNREAAIPFEKQAIARLDQLKKNHPSDTRLIKHSNDLLQSGIADDIANSQLAGSIEAKKQHIAQALDKYRQCVTNAERCYELEPTHDHAARLISSRKSLATVLIALNESNEAEKLYQNILATLPGLQLPEVDKMRMEVQYDIDLSELARTRKQYREASKYLQQALQVNQQLRARFPDDTLYLYDNHNIRTKLAQLLRDDGKIKEALAALDANLKDLNTSLQKYPQLSTLQDHRKYLMALLARYETELNPANNR